MRVYEADDIKALPSDMVREQDFILRVRRMQRSGQTWLILNLSFDALPAVKSNPAVREELHGKVSAAAAKLGGETHFMLNGDAFVTLELPSPQQRSVLTGTIVAAALPAEYSADEEAQILKSFVLPADYALLRERTSHYIDAARAAQTIAAVKPSPQQALQADQVRGPLTAWSLSQIERLLPQIELQRYVRVQPIYQRIVGDRWQQTAQEYYVSLDDLKNEHFPRVNVRTPERLFLELCCMLDKQLLLRLSERPELLASQTFTLNIAIETIFALPFAQFCRVIPKHKRAQIGFELHRADLLLDFSMTQNAIKILRDEGFRVVLDNLHPDMLPYLHVDRFNADLIKIKVGKDQISQLKNAEVVQAIRALPAEKLVFFRCDNEIALEIGQTLGISHYQGWLINDLAGGRIESL